jgi:antitoxin MazE
MTSTVSKWGNSLAIRIPKHLADRVHMQEGSCVEFDVLDGSLIVKPSQRKKYTLEELLDGMTPEHFHPEIPTGTPVGNEMFEE